MQRVAPLLIALGVASASPFRRHSADPADLRRRRAQPRQTTGLPALTAVVELWHTKVLGDIRVSPFFVGTDISVLKAHRTSYLAAALGMPVTYNGRTMAAAHARLFGHLGLNEAHFSIVESHLASAAQELGGVSQEGIAVMSAKVRTEVMQQREVGQSQPAISIAGIGTVCSVQAGFDGDYYHVGTTRSGRPWYMQDDTTSTRTLYYDPNCGGGDDGSGKWVLDTDMPSITAEEDLDQDGRCEYIGEAPTATGTRDRVSPVSGSWTVFCGGECVDLDPSGCAQYLGATDPCKNDRAVRGRCCATCTRTANGERPPSSQDLTACAEAGAALVGEQQGPAQLTCGG
eukprot:Hpha_TRINITY_DN22765_c0_g1::TRINITY_DN22765_c0_g1_i1::g.34263::m.34263